jgi:hypothetical protein
MAGPLSLWAARKQGLGREVVSDAERVKHFVRLRIAEVEKVFI